MNTTWTCHVCGKERPDSKISVHTRPLDIKGVVATENIRYCNDNPECIKAAQKFSHIPQFRKGNDT